ncbi:UDP-N-acetylmuramoyl-tripeptide--D-alanyl-D-alanine ligase [Candidatus Babeliales bacterium]|nr:UDP-N-acetylmuramoyl-tripeptide--D-alanyl-D-alanine ligase [Candidatus Babeliales bacterium]MBP9843884.1 UDP-N-acetylmuramoyl-tripeptide--D-alanyl-D-alanine ligase [Candidatus Babeliales bacterium]
MQLDKEFVKNALSNAQMINGDFAPNSSFSVDTRTLQPGDVFVALQGLQCDGHQFIGDALAKKASGLLVAQHKRAEIEALYGSALQSVKILYVEDTLAALVNLAKEWRSKFTYPVVGITGSVGKTSTKEMVANILRTSGEAFYVSYGNQNTIIGVALNILKMRPGYKAAIFEVGISDRGAMGKIADMLRPTYALITGIGHAHMQGLGALADVAAEKRAIFSCFSDANIGIINGDQDILASISYAYPVLKFGFKTSNQIQARKISIKNNVITFVAKIYKKKYSIILQGSHEGAVMNALAALSIAHMIEIPTEVAIAGVQKPLAVQGRFEFCQTAEHGVFVNDSYNANPESMKAGLLAFNAYESEYNKVLVIGDMLELGIDGAFWHRQIGRFLRKISGVKHLVLVGHMVAWTKKTAPVGYPIEHFETWQQALPAIKKITNSKTITFVKASRGVGLQNIIDALPMK